MNGSDSGILRLRHSLKLKAFFFIRVQYLVFIVTIEIWTIYPVWLVSTVGEMASLCLLFLAFSWFIFFRQRKGKREKEAHIFLISLQDCLFLASTKKPLSLWTQLSSLGAPSCLVNSFQQLLGISTCPDTLWGRWVWDKMGCFNLSTSVIALPLNCTIFQRWEPRAFVLSVFCKSIAKSCMMWRP